MLHEIGIGLPHGHLGCRGGQRRRGQLRVHRGGAVAEFGGPDVGRERAVRKQAHAGVGEVAAGGTVSIMDSAEPSPVAQSGPRSSSPASR
ncbi:hypothetical protein AHiyo4_43960 [Arthrobacter sp. Hiyo4]|nr:hypothetical protein AHiyo4_43960 [Arthrobacter sp. Hiyo4]